MQEEIEICRPYSFGQQVKQFFNKKKFSDVCFQIGEDKKEIYAIKSILSMGSPVFEQMFYGDLKSDTSKPISITDFTYDAFSNMIKYLYNNDISCVSPHEIYETYLVGDYYLVHDLDCALIKNFSRNLTLSNCAIILEQFLKIPKIEKSILKYLRRYIKNNYLRIFQSEHFLEMSQDALIAILSCIPLSRREIEILEAMTKWTIAKSKKEGLNSEEKRELFAPIKRFIRFKDISLEEFRRFDKIEELLPMDEVGLLFVYLLNNSKPYPLANSSQQSSPRSKGKKFVNQTEEEFEESQDEFY